MPFLYVLLALPQVTITPANVPARGKQEVIVQISKPGMYQIRAEIESGIACTIVDHQGGPFATAGSPGKTNCHLDLLLEKGTYKLRLTGPQKAAGMVKPTVAPFTELNPQTQRLDQRRSVELKLDPGQQASYWIQIKQRRYFSIRIFGRTAGVARLWRNGRWIEEIKNSKSALSPLPGQSIHSHHLHGDLEAGDYLLTVYGTKSKQWSVGQENNTLHISHGYHRGSDTRAVSFVIPAWGFLAYEVPGDRVTAFASLDRAVEGATTLTVFSFAHKGSQLDRQAGSCSIAAKSPIATCATQASGKGRMLLILTGRPQTSGQLMWAPYPKDNFSDGDYRGAVTSLTFQPQQSGEHLLGLHDIPTDSDGPPLSCTLSKRKGLRQPFTLVATDLIAVSTKKPLSRSFNYSSSGLRIEFSAAEAGTYQISTQGETKSRCELFRLDNEMTRLSESKPKAKRCQLKHNLQRGNYQLRLYGGQSGIEHLVIDRLGGTFSTLLQKLIGSDQDKKKPALPKQTATKATCLFPSVSLQRGYTYRLETNRAGDIKARGLVLRPLPLGLKRPLTLALDQKLQVPLTPGAAVTIASLGGQSFFCGERKVRGRCRVEVDRATNLTLHNQANQTLVLTLQRPTKAPPLPALVPHRPTIKAITQLKIDRPLYLDFARGESHSLVFDVPKAGLYHLTTQGLLSTACRMRTPTVPQLAEDRGSGRGRNCLLANYLRPGRYLASVRTVGQSRGRGAVVLSQKPVVSGPPLTADDAVFFRVPPTELLQQQLTIKERGDYQLSTTGQGVSLNCRLDDQDGWPLERVPSRCTGQRQLEKGSYRWTQMPLTVASMRRTSIQQNRPQVVLQGDRVHPIELAKRYNVLLAPDGSDSFRFDLSADLEVQLHLNNAMQGRLFRVQNSKKRMVEVIPPQTTSAQKLKLTAGRYRLETQHSRADVGIDYQLQITSKVLAPGLSRQIAVPATATLRVPKRGMLALTTSGQVDVRCRIFDQRGRLVAESSDVGDDWNCGLVEPLASGDYRLVLETENQQTGSTRVALATPPSTTVPQLTHGQDLQLGNQVVLAEVRESSADVISELHFRSTVPFSCALENKRGQQLHRISNQRHCQILLKSDAHSYRIRLWSNSPEATVRVSYLRRPLSKIFGKTVAAGEAGQKRIERQGYYKTATDAFCITSSKRGLLRPCGPMTSLPQGAVVFSTTGPRRQLKLDLGEMVEPLQPSVTEQTWSLQRRSHFQWQKSSAQSLHLLSLAFPFAEASAPACAIAGGVHLQQGRICYAASSPGRESQMRLWTNSTKPRNAQLRRWAVTYPERLAQMPPGRQNLSWKGSAVRYELPAKPFHLEVTLAKQSWAVQLDSRGHAVDLCPPQDQLNTCILGGRGGELVVTSAQPQIKTLLTMVPQPTKTAQLKGLYEGWPQRPGQLRLNIPAQADRRSLVIDGAARCVVSLQNGSRSGLCHTTIPKNQSATAIVTFRGGPLRAVCHSKNRPKTTRWKTPIPKKQPAQLPPATSVRLRANSADYGIRLEQESLISIQSDSGVCALLRGLELLEVGGRGGGCNIHRVLPPGAYRLMVRRFARRPFSGNLTWNRSPLQQLKEGIGDEQWLTPGEQVYFKFATDSRGKVGLGLRVHADLLQCRIYDSRHRLRGTGCQQYLELPRGQFVLAVKLPQDAPPQRFRPVLLGLAGSSREVPEEYLKDFFQRVEVTR